MEKDVKLYNPLLKPLFNFLFIWGIFITVFGSIGLTNIDEDNLPFRLTILTVLGLIPLIVGYFGKSAVKKNFKKFDALRTKRNLKILIQEKSELSVVDVAERLNIDINLSKKLLEELIKNGTATSSVNSSGVMVYKLLADHT